MNIYGKLAKAREELTQSRLMELLNYDPDTGEFAWRETRAGVCRSSRVGTKSRGYVRISVDGRRYMAHRLAWLYMTGEFPADQVDHINRVRSDNRWENLRAASAKQNAQNTKGAGVHFNAKLGKYIAQVSQGAGSDRTTHYLGCFPDWESARQAYLNKKAELHPFFSGAES